MPDKCFHCNGYYGSSFGQPLCPTCHTFLYDPSMHSTSIQCREKADECDSGNEEPREPSECHAHAGQSGEVESDSSSEHGQDDHNSDHENNACAPTNSTFNGQAAMYDSTPYGRHDYDTGQSRHVDIGMRAMNEDCSGAEMPFHQLSVPAPSSADPYDQDESMQELTLDWTGLRMEGGDSDISTKIQNDDSEVQPHISKMPPELLLVVFRLLDEVSLWAVGQVCRQWNQLVSSCTLNLHWKSLTQRKFPLFTPLFHVTNWHKVFTNLIESAPCQMCLLTMPYNTTPTPNDNSWRKTRLCNELKTLRTDPPEGISASPLDPMSLHWQACIRGPIGSPYVGGTFFLYIEIPSFYPLKPPIVRFITRIFHPNVSRHGDIGIDSIQHNWSLALTISKVLISIQSLLTDPYTEVCMEPRIGEMYDQNRNQFDLIAQAWTWRYAFVDTLAPETISADFLQEVIMRQTVASNSTAIERRHVSIEQKSEA